jgi:hypothetical protein
VVVAVDFGGWCEIETPAVVAEPAWIAVADFWSGRTRSADGRAAATDAIQATVLVCLASLGEPEYGKSSGKKIC